MACFCVKLNNCQVKSNIAVRRKSKQTEGILLISKRNITANAKKAVFELRMSDINFLQSFLSIINPKRRMEVVDKLRTSLDVMLRYWVSHLYELTESAL